MNYVTVLTPTEVLIYDGEDLELTVNHLAILRGWRDRPSGLWRVPLNPKVGNQKSEYIVLSKAHEEAIANVYDLPSSQQIVRYLHACAGFPTKATWISAIQKGSYATWPHLNTEAVRKHFPESNKTNQGHMRSIKQGVRSTKIKKKKVKIKLENEEELTIGAI